VARVVTSARRREDMDGVRKDGKKDCIRGIKSMMLMAMGGFVITW
jgi:hypothetical protein